jgi:neutral ceramidase
MKTKKPVGVLSNFALHLDTVGGMKWSADYPFFIERTLQQSLGAGVISIFGNGCCGDINHVNPRSTERNTAAVIGQSIGNSIVRDLSGLQPLGSPKADSEIASRPVAVAGCDSGRSGPVD